MDSGAPQTTPSGMAPESPILSNGERLVLDAELLLGAGRFASATMLAIYGIEELGKYYQARWSLATEHESKIRRVHASKQAVMPTFYMAEVAVGAVRQLLARLGLPARMTVEAGNLHRVLAWLRSRPATAKLAGQLEEGAVEIVARAMSEDEAAHLMDWAKSGQIEQLKRRAIYVDIRKNGDLLCDPASIDAATAREWVAHARHMLNGAKGRRAEVPAVAINDEVARRATAGIVELLAKERPYAHWY